MFVVELTKERLEVQTRNQEFLRAGGVFLELGHFDKLSSKTRKRKAPLGKIFGFFPLESLKNCTLDEKFHSQITIIRAFFP